MKTNTLGRTGLEVLDEMRATGNQTAVVIITAQNTMDNAVEAMKAGAYDYASKPILDDEIKMVIRRALDDRLAALGDPLLPCLLVGRRDGIPEAVADDFRRSGTAHVLAISGLHVGLLAAVVWFLLRSLPIPRPAAAAITAASLAVSTACSSWFCP